MLTCQACMKRRLQTVFGDAVPSPFPLFLPSITANHTSQVHRRNYAAAAPGLPTATAKGRPETRLTTSPSAKRQQWLDSRGVRPANKPAKNEVDQDFVVRKHLQYLKDPLKLAEHVRRCLREGDIDTTLAIVRAASKSIECTVSWNHLIEWHLSQGKLRGALRIYNEMKKRSQVPDARTYTILFNGCATQQSAPESLGKVISIYHSMLTDRSPVKPNTIHMNAILKMCARSQNMDAMFAIADQLPPRGVRAPNNLTYTTILNALRIYAVNDLRSTLTDEQKESNRRKAMLDARRLWHDVSSRWRQGDLWIDEELVCAMGRILLLGGARDHDDIMSLVEQSMNIPRQVPRQASPKRAPTNTLPEPRSQEISSVGGRTQETVPTEIEPDTLKYGQDAAAVQDESHPSTTPEIETETTTLEDEAASIEEFESVILAKSPRTSTSAFTKPGPNTLSLLMQSILYLRLREPATKYWDILTKEYGIKPDAENYHAYLRVLRVARASTDVVKLLTEMPRWQMQDKTFRIAMSTCQRDKNNHRVFGNAGKILDIMQEARETPDITALNGYLDVAIAAPCYNKKASADGKRGLAKLAYGRQIQRALSRLGPSFFNLRSLLAYGRPSDTSHQSQESLSQDVLLLTRKMISAHDLLISKGLVPTDMHARLSAQRSKLSAFVTRFKSGNKFAANRPARLRAGTASQDNGDQNTNDSDEEEQLFIRDDYLDVGTAPMGQQQPAM